MNILNDHEMKTTLNSDIEQLPISMLKYGGAIWPTSVLKFRIESLKKGLN